MSTPETNPSGENLNQPSYEMLGPVRVYHERDGERVAEDDWEYRGSRSDGYEDHEVAAKNHPDGRQTDWEVVPKSEFDDWQREKAAEEAGRLATAASAETTPEAEEIVEKEEETEEQAIEELLGSWGGFDERGEYKLLVDPVKLSKLIDVPADIIEAAVAKNISPDYLLSARDNPYTARHLRQQGIEWGPAELPEVEGVKPGKPLPPLRLSDVYSKSPRELEAMSDDDKQEYLENLKDENIKTIEDYERAYAKQRESYRGELEQHFSKVEKPGDSGDPMMYLEAQRLQKTMKVEDIADLIETNPKEVKRMLKRPGNFLPVLRLIPLVGRRTAWLLLARSVHHQEVKDRKAKGWGQNYEDGRLRIGIPRTKANYEHIKKHDEVVKVLKNKLRPWNKSEFRGRERYVARRDLAQLIHRTMTDEEALREYRQILHPSVYVHEDFAPAYSRFKDAKGAKDEKKDPEDK